MIELRDFSVSLGGKAILHDVNVAFPQGLLTALLGRNGSGKSTLLRALAGIGAKYSGEILIDGRREASSPRERSRLIAFVGSNRVSVANLSCEELVALGRAPYTDWTGRLGDADRAIVMRAMELTDTACFAPRMFATLSDGEAQRVMIARAIAQQTPVILLDEPTSFLDIPNRRRLVELLRRLTREERKTIVFSTHELELALEKADRMAVIRDGGLTLNDAASIDPAALLSTL